ELKAESSKTSNTVLGIQATSDHMRMRVFHTADLALQDEVILSTAGPANASLQLLMLSVVL
ncbi:unnamed protein product, partial [Brassica rapa subsp. trilocularis]